MQVRAGVEGRNNFQDRFAPFLQLALNRTFADRLSVAISPGVAFNTRENIDAQLPNALSTPAFLKWYDQLLTGPRTVVAKRFDGHIAEVRAAM